MLNTSQTDRITLAGIRAHPWFGAKVNMLTESLGSSQDSESSLYRSQYQNDVYVPQVEEPTRKPRTKCQSRSKRYFGAAVYKADQQPKENRIPPPIQTVTTNVDALMVAAPSSSSSINSSDSHESPANRSPPRPRAFSEEEATIA